MKKYFLIAFIAVSLFFISELNATVMVTIGTGTTANYTSLKAAHDALPTDATN